MGRYKEADWYLKSSKELITKYGDIPPPWIYAPNFHPYSMGWRMGGGETHVMILGEWLNQVDLNFDERVAYLLKYPSPARWYQWIIHFLWEVDSYEFEEEDYLPYFQKLEQLGFKNTADFEKDLDREDLD
jgi:hypothetical protein